MDEALTEAIDGLLEATTEQNALLIKLTNSINTLSRVISQLDSSLSSRS